MGLLARVLGFVFGSAANDPGGGTPIVPGSATARNVALAAAVRGRTRFGTLADHAAAGNPAGGFFADLHAQRFEHLAGRLRRGERVTVEEVAALAAQQPDDPTSRAVLHALFLQPDPAPPSVPPPGVLVDPPPLASRPPLLPPRRP